jgi:hypothetical protein
MATKDIKEYLFEQTGISQSNWKRLLKRKGEHGAQIRLFEDKDSGKIIQTIEELDGTISIEEVKPEELHTKLSVSATDTKKAQKLVQNYIEEGIVPNKTQAGFSAIPSCFNFSFYGNVDHDLDEVAQEENPEASVAGFAVFFSLKDNEEGMCEHFTDLLSSFLPSYMEEMEECSFVIHPEIMNIYDDERIQALAAGTIPHLPYHAFIALLEDKGFTYDTGLCPLACLGGSARDNVE